MIATRSMRSICVNRRYIYERDIRLSAPMQVGHYGGRRGRFQRRLRRYRRCVFDKGRRHLLTAPIQAANAYVECRPTSGIISQHRQRTLRHFRSLHCPRSRLRRLRARSHNEKVAWLNKPVQRRCQSVPPRNWSHSGCEFERAHTLLRHKILGMQGGFDVGLDTSTTATARSSRAPANMSHGASCWYLKHESKSSI